MDESKDAVATDMDDAHTAAEMQAKIAELEQMFKLLEVMEQLDDDDRALILVVAERLGRGRD